MECDIQQVVLNHPKSRHSVFVIHVPAKKFSAEQGDRIIQAWGHAWRLADQPPPALMVIPDDIMVTSLTDDQLKVVGLMRIPSDAPAT